MSVVEPTSSELALEPPGPGPWDLDAVHFPRPATLYWSDLHPDAGARVFGELGAYYGLLMGTMEFAFIKGFCYHRMLPVAPERAPERFARAEEVFANRLWRDQLREWDEVAKPASIQKHRELQAIDPEQLSDAELSEYIGRCAQHHRDMLFQHFRFTGAAIVPVGDLLAHAVAWPGVSHAELLGMIRGAAPVSAGASGELGEMVEAIRADPAAQELLGSDGDAAETLKRLRRLDSDAGRAVSAYLDLIGYRLLDGFDISSRYALEMPQVLLRTIRIHVDGGGVTASAAEIDANIAQIREKIPAEHREQFDELAGEARLMSRIRDERGVYSDSWAAGIMRRAALAAGRRLAAAGRISEAEHIVDATVAEMQALVTGSGGPTAEELAARHGWRTAHTAKQAPMHLGPPAPPPPDLSGLPPAAARMMQAVAVTMDSMFAPAQAAHEENVLRGLAASAGVYEGQARRVSGPAEFDRIVQGDVLVTESTSESFNILLPLLGAIVTDSGGLLSHPAIVSREYGIPGVVGTREATSRIADGARVRVDGDSGEVTVLG